MNSFIFGAVVAIVVGPMLGHNPTEWKWWGSIIVINAAHTLINNYWS